MCLEVQHIVSLGLSCHPHPISNRNFKELGPQIRETRKSLQTQPVYSLQQGQTNNFLGCPHPRSGWKCQKDSVQICWVPHLTTLAWSLSPSECIWPLRSCCSSPRTSDTILVSLHYSLLSHSPDCCRKNGWSHLQQPERLALPPNSSINHRGNKTQRKKLVQGHIQSASCTPPSRYSLSCLLHVSDIPVGGSTAPCCHSINSPRSLHGA